MNNTVVIDNKTVEHIVKRLDELTRDVKILKAKLLEDEPVCGSDRWWEKEIKDARKAFKKGEGTHFDSAEEAIKWLNS